MTKKEYITSLTNLIINRVTFHCPKVKGEVDYALLDAIGIDGKLPIFLFNKKIDKIYYQAFLEAQKKVKFNLILSNKVDVSKKKFASLENTYIIPNNERGSLLSSTLENLNINYISHSNFENKLDGEYLKINDKKIPFEYLPYFLTKKLMFDGVIADAKCYILNGKNYNLSFTNTRETEQEISFEFNLPLPRGYYTFDRLDRCIQIENLTNKNKAYFNFNIRGADITFSTMNGIESCTFACIHLKCLLTLLPKESKKIYFNYGENKYCLNSPKEMQYFFELSQEKMNNIFDLRVTTRDSKFDENFNLSLPRKIWEKWQNLDIDEESENSYLKMRNLIVQNSEKGCQISKDFKGLKEVKFYRNNGWKRVFIVHNNSCYLFADKVKYYNFTLLTKEIFDKNNEIYLSFAL